MQPIISMMLAAMLSVSGIGGAAGGKSPALPYQGHGPRVSDLNLEIEYCNITITEADISEITLSQGNGKERMTVHQPQGTQQKVTVSGNLAMSPFYAPALLQIPAGRYSTIRADVESGAARFTGIAAALEIEAGESALTLDIPAERARSLKLDADDSSVKVNFAALPADLNLRLDTEDSIVSLPSGWKYERGQAFAFAQGKKSVDVLLKAEDCAVSVSLGEAASPLGQPDSEVQTFAVSAQSGELLMGKGYDGNAEAVMEKLKKASTPNVVQPIDSLSSTGVRELVLDADFSGIALETSQSGNIELAYVGADNEPPAVTAETVDGVLTVKVRGKGNQLRYISLLPEARVNTVRVAVPAKLLQKLTLRGGAAGIYVGSDQKTEGGLDKGLVLVKNSRLAAEYDLTAKNGSILLAADRIDGDAELTTANGSAAVEASTVTGELKLTAQNGSLMLKASSVTGKTELSAKNGSVSVEAGLLQEAELKAVNGSLNVKLGRVGGRVAAGIENGNMDFRLTEQPQNLRFELQNHGRNENCSLPAGWADGHTVGTGIPLLILEHGSGNLEFSIG